MILLAFELSTRRPSLALVENDKVLAEESWESAQNNLPSLFESLGKMLHRTNLSLPHIDTFVVGRGPGAFTGIRIALTAARSLAMPLDKKVFTVSSGEAIAFQAAQNGSHEKIMVIGDARRGKLWAGIFCKKGQGLEMAEDWHLATAEDLPCGNILIVTPDSERLKNIISALAFYPTATAVAALAYAKILANIPSEPLEPLYLHAAV